MASPFEHAWMLLKNEGEMPMQNNYPQDPPGMQPSLPPKEPHFTEKIRQYMKENPDNPGQVPLGTTSEITPSVMPPNAKFSDYTPSQ
ncbi:hypothetical protein OAA43_00340 [bacterium]|nr:hypothetical protein [bacterium]